MLYATLLATRVINIASGLLCLIIVAGTYDAFSAGRIYTLISLAGAAAIFELGLSTLVLQRASQITREKGWDATDQDKNPALISPILGHYLVLIGVQALLLLAILLPVGLWVIVGIFEEPLASPGVLAWVVACLTMALGLPTALVMSTLEGVGQLSVVARIRAAQAFMSMAGLNLPLLVGVGYPAVAIQLTCALLVGWAGLLALKGGFLKSIFRGIRIGFLADRFRLDWPFQWRLSLSFLSGYFSNQAWVVAITLTGAVALAGQVAMTLQVLTAAVGFAMTPLAARLATLSALARRDTRSDYLQLASVLTRQAGLIFLVMVSALVLGYWLSEFVIPELQSRLLPVGPLVFVFICAPLVLGLAGLTLLNQSLGTDDLYIVSIFRIVAPISVLVVMGPDLGAWSFSLAFTTVAVLSTLTAVYIHRRTMSKKLS